MNKVSAAGCAVCVLVLLCSAGIAAPEGQSVRTLTLQEAVQLALAHSPDILIARIKAVQARQALEETRSVNMPQVTIGTGIAYNNGFPLSIEGAAPSIFQFAASQSVLSKKNRNLIREAEESRKASEIGPESARNEMAVQVAQAYYELHQARKADAFWSERVTALEKEQQIVDNLVQSGRARPLDLTLAKTAVAGARHQLLTSREQARLESILLCSMADLPEGTEIQTAEPSLEGEFFEAPIDVLYARALEVHPEILQAQSNVRAREFHLEAMKGEKYPEVALVGEYSLFSRANNYQDFFRTFTRNNFLIGLSVQYPIFNGYRTRAQIGQSREEVEASRLQLERMKSNLKLNLERNVSALKLARSGVEVARQETAAERENVQINETLLEAGRIGVKEMQTIRSQLAEKEIAALDADRILFQRKIELLHTTGTLAQALSK